ncbi:MAG: sensor histidine kinase, partial [Hyphomonadaceae bacterium]
YAAECKLRRLNGEVFDALFTACFATESVAAGKLLIGVIDISERVEAQAKLRQVQAEFAHAARVSMLGELTASIAHEVNQPLAAIATNAAAGLRWLDRPAPDLTEVRALTERIIADAQRAADVIARVRAMAGHRSPAPERLDLNGVIEEAMLFLAHELQSHRVALALDLAQELPLVAADRTQMQQVIVNLAVNALQAMAETPPAERRLGVRTHYEPNGVHVAVEDSGPGIGAGDAARVFDSFFTTKRNGLGLGLPICRSILEAHGGAIDVSNLPNGGARFAITLPAAP